MIRKRLWVIVGYCLILAASVCGFADEAQDASGVMEERLHRHIEVFRRWIAENCSLDEEQQQRLQTICRAEAQVLLAAGRKQSAERTPDKLPESAPLHFTLGDTANECITRSLLQFQIVGQLSDEQSNLLEARIDERLQWLRAGDRGCLIGAVDQFLDLSPDQWLLLDAHLKQNPTSSPIFSPAPGDSPLYYLHASVVAERVSAIELTEKQKMACIDLHLPGLMFDNPRRNAALIRGNPADPQAPLDGKMLTITVQPASEAEWTRALDQSIRELRPDLDAAVEQRVAVYHRAWELDPSQLARLRLAGKGATLKCLADLKLSTREMIRELITKQKVDDAARPLNLRITRRGLSPAEIFAHPIWLRSLEELRPPRTQTSEFAAQRRRDAILSWIMVSLDRELWLRSDQRQPLRRHLETALPEGLFTMAEPGRELLFLALAVDAIADSPEVSILNEQQQEVLERLRKQFQYEPNSVKIRRSNGEWFTIRYP